MRAGTNVREETVATVRKRVGRSASRHLNEQNTKATLIEPLLRSPTVSVLSPVTPPVTHPRSFTFVAAVVPRRPVKAGRAYTHG